MWIMVRMKIIMRKTDGINNPNIPYKQTLSKQLWERTEPKKNKLKNQTMKKLFLLMFVCAMFCACTNATKTEETVETNDSTIVVLNDTIAPVDTLVVDTVK